MIRSWSMAMDPSTFLSLNADDQITIELREIARVSGDSLLSSKPKDDMMIENNPELFWVSFLSLTLRSLLRDRGLIFSVVGNEGQVSTRTAYTTSSLYAPLRHVRSRHLFSNCCPWSSLFTCVHRVPQHYWTILKTS